jgi:hypothetical protein
MAEHDECRLTPLHIPRKVQGGREEEQRYLAIERWASEQRIPCGGGGGGGIPWGVFSEGRTWNFDTDTAVLYPAYGDDTDVKWSKFVGSPDIEDYLDVNERGFLYTGEGFGVVYASFETTWRADSNWHASSVPGDLALPCSYFGHIKNFGALTNFDEVVADIYHVWPVDQSGATRLSLADPGIGTSGYGVDDRGVRIGSSGIGVVDSYFSSRAGLRVSHSNQEPALIIHYETFMSVMVLGSHPYQDSPNVAYSW